MIIRNFILGKYSWFRCQCHDRDIRLCHMYALRHPNGDNALYKVCRLFLSKRPSQSYMDRQGMVGNEWNGWYLAQKYLGDYCKRKNIEIGELSAIKNVRDRYK